MYEYKIRLNYKVDSCSNCPFRNERVFYEDVQSSDKISGIIQIVRRQSHCTIKDQPVLMNEFIETYESKCPLKRNITFVSDEQ